MRNLLRSSKAVVVGALALGLLGYSRVADAGCANQTPDVSNDLSIECLIAPRPSPMVSSDPTLREQTMYRSLLSEVSTVMAVPVMEPGDTTGYSGFHFSFDVNATSISINNAYWSGYLQPNGDRALAGVQHVSGQFLPVASIMLRKGVWFLPLPLFPSLEIGFGASNLLQSGIYGLNGYVKFAIHEGYHDIPVPSIAVRASLTRIAGADQVDMTIITAEGIISKAFGVGGTFTLEPYLGGGALFSIIRSQVVDTDPSADLYRGDDNLTMTEALGQKIVFPTQDNIIRWRVFAGMNMHYAIVSFTGYFSYWGAGADNSYDINSLPGPAQTGGNTGGAPACATDLRNMSVVCPKDLSFSQFSVGGSIGLRF
jgi:hypothetical protein